MNNISINSRNIATAGLGESCILSARDFNISLASATHQCAVRRGARCHTRVRPFGMGVTHWAIDKNTWKRSMQYMPNIVGRLLEEIPISIKCVYECSAYTPGFEKHGLVSEKGLDTWVCRDLRKSYQLCMSTKRPHTPAMVERANEECEVCKRTHAKLRNCTSIRHDMHISMSP